MAVSFWTEQVQTDEKQGVTLGGGADTAELDEARTHTNARACACACTYALVYALVHACTCMHTHAHACTRMHRCPARLFDGLQITRNGHELRGIKIFVSCEPFGGPTCPASLLTKRT